MRVDPDTRATVRAKFLGAGQEYEQFLVLRPGSTLQTLLAEQYGHSLYEYLGDLLAEYLAPGGPA